MEIRITNLQNEIRNVLRELKYIMTDLTGFFFLCAAATAAALHPTHIFQNQNITNRKFWIWEHLFVLFWN